MTKKWSLLQGQKVREFYTLEGIYNALKHWSPFSPILIASPQNSQFLPLTCHHELAPKIVMRYKARVSISIAMTIMATLALFLGMLILHNPMFIKGFFLFLLVTIAVFFDYFIVFKSLNSMSERTKFFYWVFNSKLLKKVTLGWLLFIVVLGGGQSLLGYFSGGHEHLFYFIGTVHASVIEGEIWRLLTGPFLHSSPAHFLFNVTFLMIIGPLAWCFFSYRAVLILIFGSCLGALVSTLLGTFIDNYPYDSYAGLSSGIFALFGVVFMSGLINKKLLPKGIALHLGFVAIISIVAASVYTSNAANASHWAGFIFGIILSKLLNCKEITLTEVSVLNFD